MVVRGGILKIRRNLNFLKMGKKVAKPSKPGKKPAGSKVVALAYPRARHVLHPSPRLAAESTSDHPPHIHTHTQKTSFAFYSRIICTTMDPAWGQPPQGGNVLPAAIAVAIVGVVVLFFMSKEDDSASSANVAGRLIQWK